MLILQVHILDQASQIKPDVWWWIKADGCDILPGLGESVRGIWSGDVDHNNGDLQRQYTAYQERLKSIAGIQMAHSSDHIELLEKLKVTCSKLSDDLNFLHSGKLYCYPNHSIMMILLIILQLL